MKFKRAPAAAILRQYGELGTTVIPRRAGTLKIWATVGGKKTNTVRIKVLPKRC